jgi:hypothetical protein
VGSQLQCWPYLSGVLATPIFVWAMLLTLCCCVQWNVHSFCRLRHCTHSSFRYQGNQGQCLFIDLTLPLRSLVLGQHGHLFGRTCCLHQHSPSPLLTHYCLPAAPMSRLRLLQLRSCCGVVCAYVGTPAIAQHLRGPMSSSVQPSQKHSAMRSCVLQC